MQPCVHRSVPHGAGREVCAHDQWAEEEVRQTPHRTSRQARSICEGVIVCL